MAVDVLVMGLALVRSQGSLRVAGFLWAKFACPYLWLDATYVKVREGGRVVSMAALVPTRIATTATNCPSVAAAIVVIVATSGRNRHAPPSTSPGSVMTPTLKQVLAKS